MSLIPRRVLLSHPAIMALPAALAVLASAEPAFATFRYVSSTGSNLGACKKANKPCLTMAYAVSKANADDTVWVQDSGVITRNVVIDKDLNIFGAGATLRQLTAGIGVGRHFEIDPGVSVRMADLELTDGAEDNGGSILNAGSLTLLDCTLRDNTATERGGAIWNYGDLVVSRTTLANNVAELDGGGIANEEGGSLTVTNDSLLSDNHANRNGGAIYLGEYSNSASIQRSTLSGNTAGERGGAVFAADGWFSVGDSTLDLNSADSSGGAIYTLVKLTLSRTSFVANEASQGGAILIAADDVHAIDHSSFFSNVAGGSGGAITATDGELAIDSTEFESNQGSVGGAIARLEYASYSIDRSSFRSNQATNGGGAIADLTTFAGAPTSLTSSTFESNVATGAWSVGGAIARDTPSPGTVVNCTFFGNSAVQRGGAVHAGTWVTGFHMANVTIAAGSAAEGGAIFADATFEVRNSLLTASEDASLAHCAGLDLTGVGNLVGSPISSSAAGWDSSCGSVSFSSTGATGVDTVLGEHGGPTIGVNDVPMRTLALLPGSTAADKGVSSCELPGSVPLASDQRGLPRPGAGNACDVGAFEVQ